MDGGRLSAREPWPHHSFTHSEVRCVYDEQEDSLLVYNALLIYDHSHRLVRGKLNI